VARHVINVKVEEISQLLPIVPPIWIKRTKNVARNFVAIV
jgi:hypothetical protein